ncbi:hypothetical protein RRG08_052039 [Elysia crispata]|uniref:PiggyBac transposable element-derived protein domain-containing protein n=1 Tax=Elysia crispata TaxID=231223 RepID=A0AAE1A5K5_9GAST|nr:hypothetical protein RRG08_052039 [Elysia crispata]
MGALHPSGVTSADGLCRLRAGTGILASAKIFSMWQMKPIDWELCKQLEKMFFYNKVNLSIDEMIVGYQGRWKQKQCNASKPQKDHIQCFGLIDIETGYVLHILTY